jgi:HSP20 family protein
MNAVQANPTETETATSATPERVAYVLPAVDIYETEAGYTLEADMPGVTRDRLEIYLDQNELTLLGRRARPAYEARHYRESGAGDFRRVFELDRNHHGPGGERRVDAPPGQTRGGQTAPDRHHGLNDPAERHRKGNPDTSVGVFPFPCPVTAGRLATSLNGKPSVSDRMNRIDRMRGGRPTAVYEPTWPQAGCRDPPHPVHPVNPVETTPSSLQRLSPPPGPGRSEPAARAGAIRRTVAGWPRSARPGDLRLAAFAPAGPPPARHASRRSPGHRNRTRHPLG